MACTQTDVKLRVAFLPIYQNPYQQLLISALQRIGIEVEQLGNMPSAGWLLHNRDRVHVLHLHWLYGLYMRHYLTAVRLSAFLSHFLLAQHLGYRIVWTVHNIMPHRQPFPPMHRMVRRFVMKRTDAVIAHCDFGRNEILRRFPRTRQTYVVPIGSYAGVYPAEIVRKEARASLDLLPEQFTYLFLGNITANKGLEKFVTVFLSEAAAADVVLIAGRNQDLELVKRLNIVASLDSRIRVHAGYIPDDAMQVFLRAADVMVAPFEKILTSSSVVVGMSYGLPVIVPRMGCLPELVAPGSGILYDPQEPTALAEALRRIKTMDTAQMGARAKQAVDALRWDDIAKQTASIYQACLE